MGVTIDLTETLGVRGIVRQRRGNDCLSCLLVTSKYCASKHLTFRF